MNDADRHDQIEALTALKALLDDENADEHDVRDAAIRAVNRFDASIAAHGGWKPYSRRGSSDPETRAEADRLGRAGVERHPEYHGRLRRRLQSTIAEIAITGTRAGDGEPSPEAGQGQRPSAPAPARAWRITLRDVEPWVHFRTTTGSFEDALMIGAQRLAEL